MRPTAPYGAAGGPRLHTSGRGHGGGGEGSVLIEIFTDGPSASQGSNPMVPTIEEQFYTLLVSRTRREDSDPGRGGGALTTVAGSTRLVS